MRKRLMLAGVGLLLGSSLVALDVPAASAHCDPAAQGHECEDVGPFLEDFADIRKVPRGNTGVRAGRGSFVSQCGRNENGHFNSDNHIVAPGVSNGAHHIHDYVGNLTTNGFSTDDSLAAGGTTCRLGDKSTYFWPVLRSRTGLTSADAPEPSEPAPASPSAPVSAAPSEPSAPGLADQAAATSRSGAPAPTGAEPGEAEGNIGKILRPRQVRLEFRGNRFSRVVAMPRFLRMITGDAKAGTNGPANARAQWTCSGFTDRTTTKYPLCPRGSMVLRILDFPSCWDGQNIDSANHRTHVVFPAPNGACPAGTRAIPQLRMTLGYTVNRGASFAVDSFPEQLHNPLTDHADFENVMPSRLMSMVVSCINRGRRC
ncbi:hypothetical protein Pth03_17350 [Planotetraspora thailandica]|uniref:DUF1996 domain-containing protein n=1 Tax=Planotetraspora thailandica TaxID=487172 RepID=A0A8J3XV56_9ACTN|nr:DUF1996 domain-containing protein [Planotetraspora thailandica]GII53346.1 hypothetical protein Pth03_17350 [Planotetraspora thailandica]